MYDIVYVYDCRFAPHVVDRSVPWRERVCVLSTERS